jgi:hypothetical protein
MKKVREHKRDFFENTMRGRASGIMKEVEG